jgi:hypothetical protein
LKFVAFPAAAQHRRNTPESVPVMDAYCPGAEVGVALVIGERRTAN